MLLIGESVDDDKVLDYTVFVLDVCETTLSGVKNYVLLALKLLSLEIWDPGESKELYPSDSKLSIPKLPKDPLFWVEKLWV